MIEISCKNKNKTYYFIYLFERVSLTQIHKHGVGGGEGREGKKEKEREIEREAGREPGQKLHPGLKHG